MTQPRVAVHPSAVTTGDHDLDRPQCPAAAASSAVRVTLRRMNEAVAFVRETVLRAPATAVFVAAMWAAGFATGSVGHGPGRPVLTQVGVGSESLQQGRVWTLLSAGLWAPSLAHLDRGGRHGFHGLDEHLVAMAGAGGNDDLVDHPGSVRWPPAGRHPAHGRVDRVASGTSSARPGSAAATGGRYPTRGSVAGCARGGGQCDRSHPCGTASQCDRPVRRLERCVRWIRGHGR